MDNIQLVVIDPQNDFMDVQGSPMGVPGATEDMQRTAGLVRRLLKKLADIHVTLDSHSTLDYRHPGAWRNQKGEMPVPITLGGAPISEDDIKNCIWNPIAALLRPPVLGGKSVKEFMAGCAKHRHEQTGGAVPGLEIWPEHCIIGTPGHNVQADLMSAIQEWERERKGYVDFCVKGTNVFSEHYGAVEANDPIPNDPSTGLNTEFLNTLSTADILLIAGEASSHCVMSTVNQIADNIGDDAVSKIHLLTDCMSSIGKITDPGTGDVIVDFPAITQGWFKEMEKRGVTLTNSVDFLAA